MNTENIRFKSNRVRDIITLFHEELDVMYGIGEVSVFIDILFESFCGWDKPRQLLNREKTLNQSDLLKFHWALEDLKIQRPIQHIVGWTEFCGCRIGVDETTLIPRPETEEIVEKTIEMFGGRGQLSKSGIEREPIRVLDLCTGSGCIAIAIAKALPEAKVTAVDISAGALAKARQNARENNVDIEFVEADILAGDFILPCEKEGIALPYPFDLIISNPPYVCEREKNEMKANVLDYEPESALFVEDSEPLVFYRQIAALGKKWLAKRGLIVAEINEKLGNETLRVFEESGFEGRVERDFRDKERMIVVRKSE